MAAQGLKKMKGSIGTQSEIKKARTVEIALYRDVKNADQVVEQKEAQPICQNGVCMVTWKPAKPAA